MAASIRNYRMKATPEEIKVALGQLARTPNDPDLMMFLCHCLPLDGESHDCAKCSVYIRFAKKHPKHSPNWSRNSDPFKTPPS